MYRKPKFLETLHEIRRRMARDCDYDIDLFVQMLRDGNSPNSLEVKDSHAVQEKKPRRLRKVTKIQK
jgi:hypothetical protein